MIGRAVYDSLQVRIRWRARRRLDRRTSVSISKPIQVLLSRCRLKQRVIVRSPTGAIQRSIPRERFITSAQEAWYRSMIDLPGTWRLSKVSALKEWSQSATGTNRRVAMSMS